MKETETWKIQRHVAHVVPSCVSFENEKILESLVSVSGEGGVDDDAGDEGEKEVVQTRQVYSTLGSKEKKEPGWIQDKERKKRNRRRACLSVRDPFDSISRTRSRQRSPSSSFNNDIRKRREGRNSCPWFLFFSLESCRLWNKTSRDDETERIIWNMLMMYSRRCSTRIIVKKRHHQLWLLMLRPEEEVILLCLRNDRQLPVGCGIIHIWRFVPSSLEMERKCVETCVQRTLFLHDCISRSCPFLWLSTHRIPTKVRILLSMCFAIIP